MESTTTTHPTRTITTENELRQLIYALRQSEGFPHPIQHFTIHETHISIVVCTGKYAYKFKKPVNFGFVDFSTPEKRTYYLKRELRLNRRLAPSLYEEVVPVGGQPPKIGHTPPIEYALRMKEFPQDRLFSHLMTAHRLDASAFREAGIRIGIFHNAQPPVTDPVLGSERVIAHYVWQNFTQLQEFGKGKLTDEQQALIQHLHNWTKHQHEQLRPLFAMRKHEGYVRLGHGDLHTENMVLDENGHVLIFDCIEFNDELAAIDIMNDIAFLVMDLAFRKAEPWGWLALNWWLATTGDYPGLALLPYYFVYRALVRAKIALLQQQTQTFQRYLSVAHHWTQPSQKPQTPALLLMCGVSGTGKSSLAERLAMHGWIWLRSDVERRRLAGTLHPETWITTKPQRQSAPSPALYTPWMHKRTYDRLLELTLLLLNLGFPVIVDATFLRREHRLRFLQTAPNHIWKGILYLEAHPDTLAQRLASRPGYAASDATYEVAQRQTTRIEPPTSDEAHLLHINTQEHTLDQAEQQVYAWLRTFGR